MRVAMVYSTPMVSAQVAGIAPSKEGAQALVQRLVMQTVFDVLERQARSAFLPDPVISAILSQLAVNITYEPLQCLKIALNPTADMQDEMVDTCIIVSNTVTGICKMVMNRSAKMTCDKPMVVAVVTPYTETLSGTFSTTNIVMANWSRAMWQSVMNRAIRVLALGPSGSLLFSATSSVGGN